MAITVNTAQTGWESPPAPKGSASHLEVNRLGADGPGQGMKECQDDQEAPSQTGVSWRSRSPVITRRRAIAAPGRGERPPGMALEELGLSEAGGAGAEESWLNEPDESAATRPSCLARMPKRESGRGCS